MVLRGKGHNKQSKGIGTPVDEMEITKSGVDTQSNESGVHDKNKWKYQSHICGGCKSCQEAKHNRDRGTDSKDNGTDTLKCIFCEKEFDVGPLAHLSLCYDCILTLDTQITSYRNKVYASLRAKFNLMDIAQMKVPTQECLCSHETVLPFAIYTPVMPNGMFGLYISSLCRGCGGYRTTKIQDIFFPIMIAPVPPHSGVRLLGQHKELSRESKGMYY